MNESTGGRKLTMLRLVVTMFCMVSGGAYGLEQIIKNAGYLYGVVILLLLLPVWCIPISWLVGELASSLPANGGSYVWVRRALGSFFGFMQAWLALSASVFDMAIYPKLVVSNLEAMAPSLGGSHWPMIIGLSVVAIGVAWNLTGSQGVSALSMAVTVAIVGLFTLLVTIVVGKSVFFHIQGGKTPTVSTEPLSWLLFGRAMSGAMWNYMGWDNCSTIASEVESPQQTYPRALRYNLVLVALNYCLPVGVMALTGESSSSWEMGYWVVIAKRYAGVWLSVPIAMFGIASAFAMFVTLMMSYARIVMVLARDGWLPRFLGNTYGQRRVPVFAILACAVTWSVALLKFKFEQLFGLDVMLYGGSLVLQFAALIALRIREPNLSRPFRIAGGLPGVIVVALLPTVLLVGTLFYSCSEQIAGMSVFTFGTLVALVGVVVYALRRSSYRLVQT